MEIKVFVVDDEERQRNSIVRHVSWDRYQMRVTGESEDAGCALELARQSPPDLLITDIRLLGTDGLELSARMRRMNPRMRIIMVTGYEEFQYAKSALDIGVDAFLVKPINFDDLNAILERIYREEQLKVLKSKETTQMKEQIDVFRPIAREQLVLEAIHGLIVGEEAIRDRADAIGMFAAAGARRVLTVVVHGDRSSAVHGDQSPSVRTEERLRQIKLRLEAAAEAVCGSMLEAKATSQRGHIVLILHGGETSDFETATEQCVRRLNAEVEKMDCCSAWIGIGPPVSRLSQLSESFRLAQRAVNQRLLGGDERTFSWRIGQGSGSEKNPKELIDDFFEVLGAGDGQAGMGLLGEILSGIAGNIHMKGEELRSLCMHLVSGAYRMASEVGDPTRPFGTEQKLWEQILACREEPELLQETVDVIKALSDFIAERKKSHTQVVVQKALEHMSRHYKDNLSLRSVAESVYLSPSYLGALFRAELGVSFTDQLIRIRVQKAKEMLLHPEFKLYEVAERVGYQNIGYFTSVFRRMTGFSPKEYRDIHGYSAPEG